MFAKFARGLYESLNLFLSSYLVDPQWQRKFTIIWPTVLGFFCALILNTQDEITLRLYNPYMRWRGNGLVSYAG